jgi:cyclophilin family peptidyl-prolyl cis-trans isomerase
MARRAGPLLLACNTVLLAAALTGCGGSGKSAYPHGTPTKADAIVRTSEGSFTIRLSDKGAPHAVGSFEQLARKGFFDGTIFHRIVPGFVIQGGDPTGKGTGGPGYTTVDAPPPDARYLHGTVAMAKTSQAPAGTAGSQFFVVTGRDAGLTPDYAILGYVVRGLAVVDRIGRLGNPQTQKPTRRVVVRSIAIQPR